MHLFEIEDQSWCPDWLRRAMTGYLRVVNARLRPYAAAATPLAELINESGHDRIVDLCSGAGGPWPELREDLLRLNCGATVVCTDLWPNPDVVTWMEEIDGFSFFPDPVSAVDLPRRGESADLDGVRTMFTALHHFDPDQVRSILLHAQTERFPIAIFEITQRSVLGGLVVVLGVPLMALLLMPFVRPFRWKTLWLSYLPPLVPLAVTWDGIVSTLRSYRIEELRDLVDKVTSDEYVWRVEELKTGTPTPLTCVIGRPR